MQKEKEKYVVRFPDGLRDAVKASADENGRTMNGEIVYQLKKVYAFANEKTAPAGTETV